MAGWTIVCEPEGCNPSVVPEGKGDEATPDNRGGMVVYLTGVSGYRSQRHEVARVAFQRRASKNPDMSFEDALDEQLAKAEHVVGVATTEIETRVGELHTKLTEMRAEINAELDKLNTALGDALKEHLGEPSGEML